MMGISQQYLVCILHVIVIGKVFGSGKLELHFSRYDNADGEGDNGNQCDGLGMSECDPYFKVCLDTTLGDDTMDTCPLGSETTGNIHNMNTVDFEPTSIGEGPNPLVFPYEQWPLGGVNVKIDVWDHDDSNDHDHVEQMPPYTIIDTPGRDEASADYTNVTVGGRTELSLRIRVYCDPNWYGDYCSTQCIPQNSDTQGHYDCSPNGERQCHEGWAGSSCDINIVDECISFPCLNGGNCTDQINSYICECLWPYSGDNCETNMDPCQDLPCANGGSCTSEPEGFTCYCLVGFMGDTCLTGVDPCDPSPCSNNGVCTPSDDNATCTCDPGFTGEYCEFDVDGCEENPCIQGRCLNEFGSFNCACDEGYTGELCDQQQETDPCLDMECNNGTCEAGVCVCDQGYVGDACEFEEIVTQPPINVDDPCSSVPCKNGATCVKSRGDWADPYLCTCAPGYIGTNCDTLVDNCASSPCENSGLCENHPRRYICHCNEAWTGPNCNNDVDECSLRTMCENGGSCVNRIGQFRCDCAPGWTGEVCSEREECPCENGGSCSFTTDGVTCECPGLWTGERCEVSPCKDNPCSNQGICRETGEGFMCKCPAGYSGELCEVDTNECQSSPCLNGGECSEGVDWYRCTCPMGFVGLKCEKQSPLKSFVFEGTISNDDINKMENQVKELAAGQLQTSAENLRVVHKTDTCKSYDGAELIIFEFQVQDAENQLVEDDVIDAVMLKMEQEAMLPQPLHRGQSCGNPVDIAESKPNYGEHDQWRTILGVIVGCLSLVLVAMIVGLIIYTRGKNKKIDNGNTISNPTFRYREDSGYSNLKESGRTPRSFRCHSGDYTTTKVDIGDE